MSAGDITLATFTSKVTISAKLTKELDLSTPDDDLSVSEQLKLTGGTGAAAKGNQLWHDQRTVAYGATDSLDLSGVLSNAFGQTVTFALVRMILILNNSTTDRLTIGGGANAVAHFANSQPLRPGTASYPGALYVAAPDATGIVVTAASADILRVTHASDTSADVTYDIVIAGEQA